MKRVLLAIGMLSTATAQAGKIPAAQANELSFISLNLHGYHPMGEPTRVLESADGSRRATQSNIFYFTLDEINRGHNKQLENVASSVGALKPDVVLLQEVAAGLPDGQKTCDQFYDDNQSDALGKNTALRLNERLKNRGEDYTAALGCRGNIGWVTDQNSFRTQKIIRESNGHTETVFDFGANPYPSGMIVEGTAILVRKPWQIAESRLVHLPIPNTNETFFFQMARIQKRDSRNWYLVANLHGGHKVRHFEQAVAVRREMAEYVKRQNDSDSFAGAIVGGDLNARLFRRGSRTSEVSTIPWEVKIDGEFDYGRDATVTQFAKLRDLIWNMNIDPAYKSWASLGNDANAYARVQRAVDDFVDFVQNSLSRVFSLREVVDEAFKTDRCLPSSSATLKASCKDESRIDLIFASEHFDTERAYILFSDNDWVSTQGNSDHPGIYLRLKPQDSL